MEICVNKQSYNNQFYGLLNFELFDNKLLNLVFWANIFIMTDLLFYNGYHCEFGDVTHIKRVK